MVRCHSRAVPAAATAAAAAAAAVEGDDRS